MAKTESPIGLQFGGVYCKTDLIVLYGRHPLCNACGLTRRELIDYIAIWGMAVEFRRAKLPEPFTDTPKGWRKIAKHVGSDPRIVRSMLAKSQQKCPRKSLVTIDRKKNENRITVNGVQDKHGRFSFKDDKKVTKVQRQTDAFGSVTRTIQNRTEHNKAKKKEYICPSDLLPIEKAIQAIDAKNYNRVRIDPKYENMFRIAAKIFEQKYGAPSGIQRCIDEIRDIGLWLEGRFDIGALKRDARHIPRTRITKWFRNAITPAFNKNKNDDGGHDQPTGERRLSYAMADLDRQGGEGQGKDQNPPTTLGEIINKAAKKAGPKGKDEKK